MKKWQNFWLYFLIGYSALHLIRDVLQDTGVKVMLSTVFVKEPSDPAISSFLWASLNTYVIAIVEIILAIYCLKRRIFGKIGLLTIVIALITLFAWSVYWFFL